MAFSPAMPNVHYYPIGNDIASDHPGYQLLNYRIDIEQRPPYFSGQMFLTLVRHTEQELRGIRPGTHGDIVVTEHGGYHRINIIIHSVRSMDRRDNGEMVYEVTFRGMPESALQATLNITDVGWCDFASRRIERHIPDDRFTHRFDSVAGYPVYVIRTPVTNRNVVPTPPRRAEPVATPPIH